MTSYDDMLTRGLSVMDQSAFILARDHELPIHLFDVEATGAMRRICEGADAGTFIGPSVSTVFS
jgi:uridylate kinase